MEQDDAMCRPNAYERVIYILQDKDIGLVAEGPLLLGALGALLGL